MSVKLKDYTICQDEKLGQGNNPVYRAYDKNEQKICVKVVNKTEDGQFDREINITKLLKGLNHDNIIKYQDIIEDNDKVYIFMESCEMTLSQYIQMKKNNFSITEYLDFLQQISCGYLNLIELNIIHRDFKMDNIVLNIDPQGSVVYKIIDLGSGKILESNTQRAVTFAVGTHQTRAPEVNSGQSYDWRCDIYSLGMIILAMAGEKNITKTSWINRLPDECKTNYVSHLISCKNTLPPQIQDILDCMITIVEWRINWQSLNARVSQLLYLSKNMKASQLSITDQMSSRLSESPLQKNKYQNPNKVPQIQQISHPAFLNSQSRVSLQHSLPTNRLDQSSQSIPQASQNFQQLNNSNIVLAQGKQNPSINLPQKTPISYRMNQHTPKTNFKTLQNYEQQVSSVPFAQQNKENNFINLNQFNKYHQIQNQPYPQHFQKVTETPVFAGQFQQCQSNRLIQKQTLQPSNFNQQFTPRVQNQFIYKQQIVVQNNKFNPPQNYVTK